MTESRDGSGQAEFLSIGAFASEVRLAVSAVRFYDDCGLLPPAFVDPSSGYRYYTLDQVERGRIIRDLRAAEMSIAQIRAVLDATTADVSTLLADHGAALERRLGDAQDRLAAAAAALIETETNMPTTCVLPASDFAAAVRQVAPAAAPLGAAPDQTIRIIEGVLVAVSDGALQLVATDRYRLAIRELVPTAVDGADARVVVEVADLEAAAAACPSAGEVSLVLGEESLGVTSATTSTTAGAITTGPFPPYERLLPQPGALIHRVLLPVAALQVCLEPLVDRGVVALQLDGGAAVAPLHGASESIVGSEVSGPPVTIGVNPKFILDAAQLAVGPEVLLEASSPTKPMVLRSAADGSYTCLIMPVRTEFPSEPQNLTFVDVDERGLPTAWRTPPPEGALSGAPAFVTINDGALSLTVARAGEQAAAWQVIDATGVRNRAVTFTATTSVAMEGDGAARLALEPVSGEDPLVPPGDARVLSEAARGHRDESQLVVTAVMSPDANWLRLAMVVEEAGTARFSQLKFTVR